MVIVVVVINLTIVNYFQLKVAGIAAIQKCETREQEIESITYHKWIKIIYLPIYIILTSG